MSTDPPCPMSRLMRHGRWVLGLTQADLAARLGVDLQALRAIERGRATPEQSDQATLTAIVPLPAPGLLPPRE